MLSVELGIGGQSSLKTGFFIAQLVKFVTIGSPPCLHHVLPGVAPGYVTAVRTGRTDMKSGPLAMIVDDNAMVAEVVRSVCASSGYRTKVFANAWDALSVLSKIHPDIIVMDIHMPGLTGNDFLRRIAAPPNRFAKTPIAIFSGDSDPAQIDPVSGKLNVKVFVKPEGIRQLAAFLKERRRELDEANL